MKTVIAAAALLASTSGLAGSGVGGGTPPARQELETMLMSQQALDGGLFATELGDVGLLTRKYLLPEVSVSLLEPLSPEVDPAAQGQKIALSEGDVAALRHRSKTIEATGGNGQTYSYKVLPGETLNEVVLKDRRLIMREPAEAGKVVP